MASRVRPDYALSVKKRVTSPFIVGYMKYLILILLVYLAYRLFAGKPLLGSGGKQTFINKQEADDPDYVDYEEVE